MFYKILICSIVIFCYIVVYRFIKKRKIRIKLFFEKHFQDRGMMGEKTVGKTLKSLSQEKYRVFNNILLKTNSGTTQIDHLVISQYGIFVIETKNYKGVINAKNNSKDWYQCINNTKEMQIDNPVTQNLRHIKHLMKSFEIEDQDLFKSIIAFNRSANVVAKSDYSDICYYDELINNIEKYYVKIITEKDVEKYCDFVKQNNIMNTQNMKKHTEYVKGVKLKK